MPVGTAVDLIRGSMPDRRDRLDPADPSRKAPNFPRAAVTEPRGLRLATAPRRAYGYGLCSNQMRQTSRDQCPSLGHPPRRVKAQILSDGMRFGAHKKCRTISTKASCGRAHG
jgi:hypothetical protein